MTLASLCQSSRALWISCTTARMGDGCKAQDFGVAQQLADGGSPLAPSSGSASVHCQAARRVHVHRTLSLADLVGHRLPQ